MYKCWFTALFVLVSGFCLAQELNCTVVVNAERVQTTERRIFQEMETEFARFLNDRKWTTDEFLQEERITCNILITIQAMPAIGNFEASVQVLSVRPVYGTSYESVIFNFADRDWQYSYNEGQPLQFSDNTFTDNISSLLAFYAYVIIGLDYDSYERMGGSAHFQTAWNIVNNAQQSGFSGWDQFENNRNRYWLAENFINQQMQPFREGNYEYHRLALDIFLEEPDQARVIINDNLKKMQAVNQIRPNTILKISTLDAKSDELTKIFSEGERAVRTEAYNTLTKLDPRRTDNYQPILDN